VPIDSDVERIEYPRTHGYDMNTRATILILFLLAASPQGCCTGGTGGPGLAIGDQAPAVDVQDVHGLGTRSLADYDGQVVLLNFWASWCMPCRMEMPELEALWTRYQDEGFVILAVSVDEDVHDAREFLDAVPVSFPVGWDETGSVGNEYRVSTLPRTILIDRQGRVRGRYDGFDTATLDALGREIAGLLEEGA